MDDRMDSVGTGSDVGGILDRGDFLKLVGAAGIGAAAGASLLPAGAGAAVRTNLDPTDFSFRTRAAPLRHRNPRERVHDSHLEPG